MYVYVSVYVVVVWDILRAFFDDYFFFRVCIAVIVCGHIWFASRFVSAVAAAGSSIFWRITAWPLSIIRLTITCCICGLVIRFGDSIALRLRRFLLIEFVRLIGRFVGV